LEEIRLYDTRTRSVRPLEPLEPGTVGIYTCGPTVYAPQTLGNMRSQLVPDLLRRVLIAAGDDVTFDTNITDVGHLVSDADEGDDKMEKAAAARGETAAEVAARFTTQWADDRRRLGCLEPDIVPRAADHIAEQIAMVETLEAQGHTYVIDDGVYFDTSTFPAYADFAGLRLDELEATGRVDTIDKRHPADFALWKLTPPGVKRQQEWDSPWGRGFPGWHIECSAMATKYLGERFDIHTGGIDHVRVHHTNEVAQSECALDVHPWVGHWVHTEFLDLGGEKISKSKGHVLTVDTLVDEGIDPLAFRYFSLQGHYRQNQAFSLDAVRAAGTALRRLRLLAFEARSAGGSPDPDRLAADRRAFWSALADDLNAPAAIAALWDAVRRPDDVLTPADMWALLEEADTVLALGLGEPPDADQTGSDERIDALIAERAAARAAKDFATSDRIRDELAAEGIEVVDTPTGATWRRT
jgi:cysteinyl-tRNA synthetase